MASLNMPPNLPYCKNIGVYKQHALNESLFHKQLITKNTQRIIGPVNVHLIPGPSTKHANPD